MKRLIFALLLASVLGLVMAACVAVPVEQPMIQERGLGSVTAVNIASSGRIRWTPQVTVSVGLNTALAPTSTFVPINGTVENAGIDSIATASAGTLLVLHVAPTTTASVLITDTAGAIALTGNLTLGAGDSLTLISDGIRWVELAASNN